LCRAAPAGRLRCTSALPRVRSSSDSVTGRGIDIPHSAQHQPDTSDCPIVGAFLALLVIGAAAVITVRRRRPHFTADTTGSVDLN
jgi:hypothetical protein